MCWDIRGISAHIYCSLKRLQRSQDHTQHRYCYFWKINSIIRETCFASWAINYMRTVLMRQACLSHCNLDWWNRETVTLSRPHGAILSDLQSLAQSAQGPLSTPTVPSKMGNKLNYCNFFILMNFFRLAWQCLSNSLYCPGAPKAFPGLLNRSWWPTLQKSISLYCTGYGYIVIHHIVTFLKDSELDIQVSF